MKLTENEEILIKKLADLLPEFDEIAKATWPDMFERNKQMYLQVTGRINRDPIHSKNK